MWSWTDSNRRPSPCKGDALPTELQPQKHTKKYTKQNLEQKHTPIKTVTQPRTRTEAMVGLGRFELPTSRLSGVHSHQLSYRPIPASSPTTKCYDFCQIYNLENLIKCAKF